MDTKQLASLYQAGHNSVRRNLGDISEEESLTPPPGGANCVNWVFGHIVATRQFVLGLAGGQPWWDEEQHRTYSAGDDGEFAPERALPLEVLLPDYDRSQEL